MNKTYIFVSIIVSFALIVSAYLFFESNKQKVLAEEKKILSEERIYKSKMSNLKSCLSDADVRFNDFQESYCAGASKCALPQKTVDRFYKIWESDKKNCYSAFSD